MADPSGTMLLAGLSPMIGGPVKPKSFVCFSAFALVILLASLALAQSYSVIHTFTGADGAYPSAGVTIRGANLFGTTKNGGIGGVLGPGTVYEMTHAGSGWSYSPIFVFREDQSGGSYPVARVIFGPDGHLYGTTTFGGTSGCGVVFYLVPPLSVCKTANCMWKEYIVHHFGDDGSDACVPSSGDLVWDKQGNIYGASVWGGQFNAGTVYEMTKSGNGWAEGPIYAFYGWDDGKNANGVTLDNNGHLFGTTQGGGLYYFDGVVFELTNVPGIGWQQTVLRTFAPSEAASPLAGLTMDNAGNLYGTTAAGGSFIGGTAFKLSPSALGWTFKSLYSFYSDGGVNCGPQAPLTMDSAGNLYGTSFGGPECGYAHGNVFKLTNFGYYFSYTSLYEFTGGSDGGNPTSAVAVDAEGTLYGTTSAGGNFDGECANHGPGGCGVVWMIKP